MSVPTQQKALVLKEKQGDWGIEDVPVPKPGPGEILVKVKATGLNPVDWMIKEYGIFLTEFPAVLGLEAAGTVAVLGEGVTQFSVGDKVLYEGSYENHLATYQEYSIIAARFAAKIPTNVSFDQAATVPVGLATAAIALYGAQSEGGGAGYIPPFEESDHGKYSNEPLFIVGGSTTIGQFAIQLGKLSGFSPIITTASPHNSDLLKSFGATHVIDRKLDQDAIVAEVRKITSEPIKLIFDAISIPTTQGVAYDILASGGQLILSLQPTINKLTDDKRVVNVRGSVHFPIHQEFGAKLFSHVTNWLESEAIKPTAVEPSSGLNSIPKQLERLKAGEISAKKLVVRVSETA